MPGFTLTPDLSASARYFASDLTRPFVLEDGMLQVPIGLGIGVEPLPEVLASDGVTIETLFQR
jgi:O-succinylbenzoate synthase